MCFTIFSGLQANNVMIFNQNCEPYEMKDMVVIFWLGMQFATIDSYHVYALYK